MLSINSIPGELKEFSLENHYRNALTERFTKQAWSDGSMFVEWAFNIEMRIVNQATLNMWDEKKDKEFDYYNALESNLMVCLQGGFLEIVNHNTPDLIKSMRYNDIKKVLRSLEYQGDLKNTSKTIDELEISSPSGNLKHCHAIININAPNDVLIDKFKEWLKEQKTMFGQNNPYEKYKKLRSLYNSRVLAYIDLSQWIVFNQSCPLNENKADFNEAICSLLFPNLEDYDERLKTTQNHAKELLTVETLKYVLQMSDNLKLVRNTGDYDPDLGLDNYKALLDYL